MTGWTADQLPDLDGRRAVVTGANSGLGLEVSRELARAGARVILACRDTERGEQVRTSILEGQPQADVAVERLDLASLASVRRFAAWMQDGTDGVDLLVNNAGVMAPPLRRTEDGFELQFGTNHLGHFALTGLLLPLLTSRLGARVVTVSSLAHRSGRLRFDDLNAERAYSPWAAYGQSKLANLLFVLELQRRLTVAGSPVLSVGAHPGFAATKLLTRAGNQWGSTAARLLDLVWTNVLTQSAAAGALPLLYAATMPDVRGGEYFGPSWLRETRGAPKRAYIARHAQDPEAAARLWEESERLTGVTFPFRR